MAGDSIYKVCGRDEWAAAKDCGVYDGSADDIRDGYIHFSTAAQLEATLAKHFAGRGDLILLAVDPSALGEALKWEPSRGGALFPHLYAPLSVDAVQSEQALPLAADGTHRLPAGVT